MSDQKKFEQAMGGQADANLKRQWNQQFDAQAVKHFTRAANICEMCGVYMNREPKTGREHKMTEWELKWSVHKSCADAAHDQLDRASQMNSRRS